MNFSKKSRKECFFGLHFDFHALDGDTIGSIINTESIKKMLDATRPDFIQVDTKGHAGISSYMTKAGVHPSDMRMDVLKVWRELTAKRGIRLYAHHSGLYDQKQARLHPEWAVVAADGTVSDEYMSPFGPYADEVLIPQLKEIAGEYGVNGAWVDGECWGAFVDYSEHAQKAWKEKKGTKVPYPGDADYESYREFCREGFCNYVTHYIQEVKAEYPGFEMTSNWMYSHHMPEKRKAPIDFISGDYSAADSVRNARYLGRCCASRGITWDLMAWGQNSIPVSWEAQDRCTKEGEQLCQEAAVIVGLGGGFQFFNILYGTGGLVQDWAIDSWKQVADFCRERERFCFRAESMADIGVLYPKCYYKEIDRKSLFMGSAWPSARGWISAIADIGFGCDVIIEDELADLSKYKVIIMPTADTYDIETINELKEFANNGGVIIADGGVLLDKTLSGAIFAGATKQMVHLDGGNRLTALNTHYYEPTLLSAKELLYNYKKNYYYEPEKQVAAIVNRVGEGKIVSSCVQIGTSYRENITYAFKQYIKCMFDACGYVPFVQVEGSDYADVTLMQKDGKMMINILNMAGEHSAQGVRGFREIPKIGPLTVKIRLDEMPEKAIWQPSGKELQVVKDSDGYVCVIDRLHIHGIVEVQL